jgi:hypothetical protein
MIGPNVYFGGRMTFHQKKYRFPKLKTDCRVFDWIPVNLGVFDLSSQHRPLPRVD